VKTIWFFTEFVVGFVLIYFNLAIVFSVVPVGGNEESNGVKIYVKSNGIHTDICVPVT
jgi:ABC-type Na+ efflux pump permease subunit